MLELGRKLGFSIKSEADDGDNELVIHFGKNQRFDQPEPDHTMDQDV